MRTRYRALVSRMLLELNVLSAVGDNDGALPKKKHCGHRSNRRNLVIANNGRAKHEKAIFYCSCRPSLGIMCLSKFTVVANQRRM